jgi:hypothetical protein
MRCSSPTSRQSPRDPRYTLEDGPVEPTSSPNEAAEGRQGDRQLRHARRSKAVMSDGARRPLQADVKSRADECGRLLLQFFGFGAERISG